MTNSTPGAATIERVAHRGAPRERRENTLPGFLLALERGADAIELDTHVTRDGVVVVHHDAAVRGRVIAASAWSELAPLDLGDGALLPRLDDVLSAVGGHAMVYVELKGERVEDAVLDVLLAHGDRYALHAFDHEAVARVALRAPDVRRGVLLDRGVADPVAALGTAHSRTGASDAWPHHSLVDAAFVAAAHALEMRVIPWTVNDTGIALSLRGLGVDSICTDDVRLLANLQ